MQHSRIGRCAVSTRDLMNNTHARLVCVLFRHWHFCSVTAPSMQGMSISYCTRVIFCVRIRLTRKDLHDKTKGHLLHRQSETCNLSTPESTRLKVYNLHVPDFCL